MHPEAISAINGVTNGNFERGVRLVFLQPDIPFTILADP